MLVLVLGLLLLVPELVLVPVLLRSNSWQVCHVSS